MRKSIVSLILCGTLCVTPVLQAAASEAEFFTVEEILEENTAAPEASVHGEAEDSYAEESANESAKETQEELYQDFSGTEDDYAPAENSADMQEDIFIAVDPDYEEIPEANNDIDGYDTMMEYEDIVEAEISAEEEELSEFVSDEESVLLEAGEKKGLVWENGAFVHYDDAGKKVSLQDEKLGYYLKDKGYYRITYNGETYNYNLNSEGVPQIGAVTLLGKQYYFDDKKKNNGTTGAMYLDGWLVKDGLYRKYDTTTGERKHTDTPWVTKLPDKGDTKYLLDKNGKLMKKKLAEADDKNKYLSDKKGAIVVNKVEKYDGVWYSFDSKGRMQKNAVVEYKNKRYYFGSNGKLANYKNGWYRCKSKTTRYYYFGSTAGQIVEKTGWQLITIDGKAKGWFYFSKSGNHYVDKWAGGLYFRKDGRLASGVTEVAEGKYCFFTVSTVQEHKGQVIKGKTIYYKGKYYIASKEGYLSHDKWKTKGGNDYYCQSDCSVLTNAWKQKDGKWGYCDASGKLCKDWIIVNNSKNLVKCINPNQKASFYTSCSAKVNGQLFWFDSNGYRINNAYNQVKALNSNYGPKYLECDRINGIVTAYTDSSKTIPIRSFRCSVGLESTPTPTVTRKLKRYNRWQELMGPSWGQYATHFAGISFVHSVAGSAPNPYAMPASAYDRLGYPASHGCIRMCVADAKWIYDLCDGSTMKCYDGTYIADDAMKGPLGKPPLTPRTGSNYDPTDPSI